MFPVLICLLSLTASAGEPVVSAWIRSRPAAGAELRKVLPDVHEVVVQDEYVEVRSAGLSLWYLGPFQNPLTGDGGLRDLRFRIPRRPSVADGAGQRIGPGVMGVFLNGVPLYNPSAGVSYLGRNMWHFDPITHPQPLGVLEPMIANGSAHSPILGFALDGFPIYGPWAFANGDGSGGLRRMRSGYRLRRIHERVSWADGTLLTPSQYGPPVDREFPLGTFAEDYEYRPDTGDLDTSNGRFSVTPEYPNGTYAYFLTTAESGELAFPYLLTETYRGKLPAMERTQSAIEAGKPAELRFAFPGARALEIVHEKPIHLIVVSSDLAFFDHIHPEWQLGGRYAVTYSFPRAGRYRLFAQFTRPGEAEQVESFDVDVTGDAPEPPAVPGQPITAKLIKPEIIRTGEDVPFTVELKGAPIEPYLGAWGHFVLLDTGLRNFIHAHPADSAGPGHVHGVSGPPPSAISFTTNFSEPGNYKLWAQFQVAGRLVAIPFTVEVTGGIRTTQPAARIPEGAISVTVDARGFTPARIEAAAAKPVTLAITRAATPNCASRIVFPSLGIGRDLPVGETIVIELPKLSGDLAFTCGMGMFRGMIVAATGSR